MLELGLAEVSLVETTVVALLVLLAQPSTPTKMVPLATAPRAEPVVEVVAAGVTAQQQPRAATVVSPVVEVAVEAADKTLLPAEPAERAATEPCT